MNSQNNEESFQSLSWAISQSQEQFKLIFAHCKYASLHKQLGQQLKKSCYINIQEIQLQPSTLQLYLTIREQIEYSMPKALMIFGLDSVDKIDNLLVSMNQVREEFRKNLSFPLILWVNDQIEQKLIRLTPDFESWGTTISFTFTSDEVLFDLIENVGKRADQIFLNLLRIDAEDFLKELSIPIENRAEIDLAIQDLHNRNIKLDQNLEAKVKFMLGRDSYAGNNIESALSYSQESLEVLKKSADSLNWRLLLLLHICVYNCYTFKNNGCNQYINECFYLLFRQQDLSLLIEFFAKLGEIFQCLQSWENLRTLAQCALEKTIEKVSINCLSLQLAQAYSFLAEVALSEADWSEAHRNANQALQIINEISLKKKSLLAFWWKWYCKIQNDQPSEPEAFNLWFICFAYHPIFRRAKKESCKSQYQFILGKSQAGLCLIEEAIESLEMARLDKDLVYLPRLHVKILENLRSLYFQQHEYLRAFNIKQNKHAIEYQYFLKAFIGSSRLQPERDIAYSDLENYQEKEYISRAINTSTRNKNVVNEIITRIKRSVNKLVVLHGKPGVGKTSMLQAGLIPVLKHESIDSRNILVILQQEYNCWVEILGEHLAKEIEHQRNIYLLSPLNSSESIINQLRNNADQNLMTILIFDELEYLFFYYSENQYKDFYNFLDQCLGIPYVKVIISLRDDYLFHFLELNRLSKSDILNNNSLDKQFLYDLGDFSLEDTKLIVEGLTQKVNFSLESLLIDQIIRELTDDTCKVMPFELQILMFQLEKKGILTLEKYYQYGGKQAFIKEYLQEVIEDCGTENEEIAKLVLYFLTDKQNTRLRKNRTSLQELLEVKIDKLEPILYILMKSWILIQDIEFQDMRYQLSSDSLPVLINQEPEFIKTAELIQKKEELRQSLIQARVSEVEQLSALAQAEFLLNDQLTALIKAVKAGKLLLENEDEFELERKNNITYNLRQVIYEVKELNRLQGHDDGILDISVCRNRQIIASASIDGTLKLWEFDGKLLKSFKGHNDWIYGIAFSPDGSTLASVSDDKTIKLWRLKFTSDHFGNLKKLDVYPIIAFEAHSAGVRSVCFSPDGNMLASSSEDGTIKLWKLDSTLVQTFSGHSGGVRNVCFSPNGLTLASASDDRTIKLWAIGGTEILTFKPKDINVHLDWVWDVRFSPKGNMLASASADTTAKLWNLDGTLKATFLGHRGGVKRISFSPDGNMIATASADGDLKLWQLDGTEIETFHGHGGGVQGISFSVDGKTIVSGSSDKTIRLWQIDGIALKTIKAHTDWIWGVAFSNNGKLLASVSADKTVKIWDVSGALLHTCTGHNHLIRGIHFSPNSEMLASGSADGTVKIWDVNNGNEIGNFMGHKSKVWSVRFSPNSNTIVSSSNDKTVKLWQLDGSELKTFNDHNSAVRCVRFSSDGKKIASGGADGWIKIWDLNGKELISFQAHTSTIRGISLNSNSTMIASASADGTVKIWRLDGTLIHILRGHTAGVSSVMFSPDGTMLASCSSDLKIILWKVDGTLIHTLRGHTDLILSISFSHDGNMLASASADKTIKLWQLDRIKPQGNNLKEILKDGCQWLKNYLNTKNDISICDIEVSANKPQHSNISKEIREIQQQLQDTLLQEKRQRQRAEIAEIKALNSLAEALWLSNDYLGSLVASLKAGNQLKDIHQAESHLTNVTANLLGNITYRIQERNRIEGHSKFVQCVQFSKIDNIFASASVDATVKIWNIDGELISTCVGHDGEVNSLQFHPNGKIVVSAGADGTIRIWTLNGKPLKTIVAHDSSINNVCINLMGNMIASAGADDKVKLWNFKGELIKIFEGHTSFVNSLDFHPLGDKIISASADKTLRLWNIGDDSSRVFEGHTAEVNSVQFSPSGYKIVSASADCKIKLWNIDDQESCTFEGHTSHVKNVCFSHNGDKIASAGTDGKVKLWYIDGTEIQNFYVRGGAANYVSFSKDDQMIAIASIDEVITLWNIIEKDIKTFREYNHELMSVCFSPNNKLMAVTSTDGTIKILTIAGREQKRIKAHDLQINSICFSPDSTKIASASGDHLVKVWNIEGEELGCFSIHSTWVTSVCFSPDGKKIISSSAHGEVKSCSLDDSQEPCFNFTKYRRYIKLISWSPDGEKIAAFSINDIVTIWNREGEELKTFKGNVQSLCFSPDSQSIAFGMADGTVRVCSLRNQDINEKDINIFTKHSLKVNSIYFSSDGKKITSASIDGTVKLWDLDGTDEKSWRGPSNWLKSIWVSPDGQNIASVTMDNTLILWNSDLNFELHYLLDRASDWVRGYLKNNPKYKNSQ